MCARLPIEGNKPGRASKAISTSPASKARDVGRLPAWALKENAGFFAASIHCGPANVRIVTEEQGDSTPDLNSAVAGCPAFFAIKNLSFFRG
jgi:hypothetical protein